MTTALILLAYNEEAGIQLHLDTIQALGVAHLRIIVVNDGSTDRTGAILAELSRRLPLEILSHPVNRGVAAAFKTGLRHAAATLAPSDFIITMEADATNDVRVLPPMLAHLEAGYDVVCASRYRPGGGYEGFPFRRRLLSVCANHIARGYCRVPSVTDYTFFYRGYRAALLQDAFRRYGDRFIETRGFAANVEMLVKLRRLQPLRATETPALYRYGLKRSRSTLAIGKTLVEYLQFFLRDTLHPLQPLPKHSWRTAAE